MTLAWCDAHAWIMFLPLLVSMAPMGLSAYLAVRFELAVRFADFSKPADQSQAGDVAEYLVWEGTISFPGPPDPELGVAYLTITPDTGLLTLPALIGDLCGEPPPVLTAEDFERIHRDMYERDKADRLAEINSVVCQHERVYHPLPV